MSTGCRPLWPAETIWQVVEPLLPAFSVEILPEIDSTNTELMRRIRAGRAEPTLLVAERQTAGRGRLGRQWQADAGASLTFSLTLPLAPQDWSGLSLAVGVSVADSLHSAIKIKWPNDLWLDDRKLAGILIETASIEGQRHAVIGVGINITPRTGDGMSTPPASLQELLPEIGAAEALERIAAPLVKALLAFERSGFEAFRAAFARRDLLKGRPLVTSDGTNGMGQGVDETGALLLATRTEVRRINSAEVSVRPAGGAFDTTASAVPRPQGS